MLHARNHFEDQGIVKSGRFSLQIGAPNAAYFKRIAAHLEDASKQLQKQNQFEETLQYGVREGGVTVRQEIANFLSRQYESPVSWEDIFVTGGASSGLQTLLKHFFTPDQLVFAENPTYTSFAKQVNRDKVMTGVPIPLQSDGLDLDYFERELEKLPEIELTERRPYRAAVYLITVHHNPSGCCYSPEKCEKLIKLARKYNLLIICDDVYNTLNYSLRKGEDEKFEPSPLRLFAYDRKTDPDYKGNVVSNGSFSKFVAPGLRMGWNEAPSHIIQSLYNCYLVCSGAGQCCYVSYVVAEALKAGWIDKCVQSLKVAHKARMETVIKVIESKLSQHGVTITHPKGGYFLWVKLPAEIDSARVLEISKENENVTFIKGNLASIRGDFSNYIRLSIAYYEAEELEEAATRLSRSILTAIKEKEKL